MLCGLKWIKSSLSNLVRVKRKGVAALLDGVGYGISGSVFIYFGLSGILFQRNNFLGDAILAGLIIGGLLASGALLIGFVRIFWEPDDNSKGKYID